MSPFDHLCRPRVNRSMMPTFTSPARIRPVPPPALLRLLWMLGLIIAPAALADTEIYQCIDADGRVTFAGRPCPGQHSERYQGPAASARPAPVQGHGSALLHDRAVPRGAPLSTFSPRPPPRPIVAHRCPSGRGDRHCREQHRPAPRAWPRKDHRRWSAPPSWDDWGDARRPPPRAAPRHQSPSRGRLRTFPQP